MARNTEKLDGGVPVGPPQFEVTPGNIIEPVEGFASDAGLGKPPRAGAYGAIADESIPTGSKMPGGNEKAMTAWFGTKNPGGGGRNR